MIVCWQISTMGKWLERESGKRVESKENYLVEPEGRKRVKGK